MENLKNLEIEKQSLLRKRRINELKKMVEQKQKSVYDLSKEEEEQSTFIPTVTPAPMYDDAGISNPVVTTRNLKKMAGKLPQKPLGNLLGHGMATKIEMRLKCCLVQLVLAVELA